MSSLNSRYWSTIKGLYLVIHNNTDGVMVVIYSYVCVHVLLLCPVVLLLLENCIIDILRLNGVTKSYKNLCFVYNIHQTYAGGEAEHSTAGTVLKEDKGFHHAVALLSIKQIYTQPKVHFLHTKPFKATVKRYLLFLPFAQSSLTPTAYLVDWRVFSSSATSSMAACDLGDP